MLALYAELGTTPSYPQELRKAAYTLPARLRVTLHPQHNAGLRTITPDWGGSSEQLTGSARIRSYRTRASISWSSSCVAMGQH